MRRTIPITTDDLQLLPAVKRLTFAKGGLPINRIQVAGLFGRPHIIVVSFTVPHAKTGQLTEFAWPLQIPFNLGIVSPRSMGDQIRSALREVMTHEIDECLMLDGEHLNDPHP